MAFASKLKDEHKRFIMRCLARFMTPGEVAAAVKQQFEVEITPQTIEHYDPSKAACDKLAPELDALLKSEREKYLREIDSIPIASRAVRLARLEKLYANAERSKNVVEARNCLEQAAKERGGAFTNRRQVSGPNGGPIEINTPSVRRRKAVERALDHAMEGGISEDEARAQLIALGVDEHDLSNIPARR